MKDELDRIDPKMPIEEVDARRSRGLDPDEVGRRGQALAERLFGPYRDAALIEPRSSPPPLTRVRWWHRLTCSMRGHDWIGLIHTTRTINLMHVNAMAGTLQKCRRCRAWYNDLPDYVTLVNAMDAIDGRSACKACDALDDMPCDLSQHRWFQEIRAELSDPVAGMVVKRLGRYQGDALISKTMRRTLDERRK